MRTIIMTKEVQLKQVSGITFVAKANSNHWVVMDGSPDFGGSLAGSTPKELLLMALTGCTSTDVVSILKKRQTPLQGYEVNVKGVEREEHPRIFTSIHVEYVFYGEGINKADVERAIDMSVTKYCSVSAILSASVPITHSYRIEPATVPAARPAS
jgi:putative redox protein